MDALKGHRNGTILGCLKREEPTYTKKGVEFLRTRWRKFLGPKLLECACTPSMCSVNAIMVATVAGINSRGQKLRTLPKICCKESTAPKNLLPRTFHTVLAVCQAQAALAPRHGTPHAMVSGTESPTRKPICCVCLLPLDWQCPKYHKFSNISMGSKIGVQRIFLHFGNTDLFSRICHCNAPFPLESVVV